MISCSLKCKIAVVGDAFTGKSSLISRFMDNNFTEQYNKTMYPSIRTKKIKVPVEKIANITTLSTNPNQSRNPANQDPSSSNQNPQNNSKIPNAFDNPNNSNSDITIEGVKKIEPKNEVEVFVMDVPGDIPEKEMNTYVCLCFFDMIFF